MGSPPRTNYDCHLRSTFCSRAIHTFCLSKHHSIYLCSPGRLPVPLRDNTQGSAQYLCISIEINPIPTFVDRIYLLFSLTIWLCCFVSCGLYYLYPCQVMQAASGDATASDYIPKILPIIKIPSGSAGYRRSGCLHALSSLLGEKSIFVKEQQFRLGPFFGQHQSSFRWHYKFNSRPYFLNPQNLHRASNDGSSELALYAFDGRLLTSIPTIPKLYLLYVESFVWSE